MRRLLPRAMVIAVGLVLVTTSAALATMSSSASATATYSTATLNPPTSPSVIDGSCTILASASLTVSWTPSTSTWADGYEVLRSTSAGGPFTVQGTVAGAGTSTYTDASLPFSTTYYYEVRATKQAWRSASSAVVSKTTLSLLCL